MTCCDGTSVAKLNLILLKVPGHVLNSALAGLNIVASTALEKATGTCQVCAKLEKYRVRPGEAVDVQWCTPSDLPTFPGETWETR